jgi:hypothetical protein
MREEGAAGAAFERGQVRSLVFGQGALLIFLLLLCTGAEGGDGPHHAGRGRCKRPGCVRSPHR